MATTRIRDKHGNLIEGNVVMEHQGWIISLSTYAGLNGEVAIWQSVGSFDDDMKTMTLCGVAGIVEAMAQIDAFEASFNV